MSDVWKLRKYKAELREESQHVTGHCLNIILSPNNDEPGNLVTDQNVIPNRDRVLHAVQPFGHLEIEGGGCAPANWRCDDHRIGPMHQGLVDLIHLVGGIHLSD